MKSGLVNPGWARARFSLIPVFISDRRAATRVTSTAFLARLDSETRWIPVVVRGRDGERAPPQEPGGGAAFIHCLVSSKGTLVIEGTSASFQEEQTLQQGRCEATV